MSFLRKKILVTAAALLMPSMVFAQETVAEINEIIRGLNPNQITQNTTGVNGTQNLKIVIKNQQEQLLIDYGNSVELEVLFQLNSALLTADGIQILNNLSAALKSEPIQKFRYLIAGHTDASGSDAYNYQLSLRRANAVKQHLVNVHGINPSRFVTFGWGESRLEDPSRPFHRSNRRVEISLITENVTVIPQGVDVYVETAQNGPKLLVAPARSNGIELTVQNPLVSPPQSPTQNVGLSTGIAKQENQRESALSHEECVDRIAKDPRPQTHQLDDFNTGRTPLPCETQKNNQPSNGNLKINF